MTPFAKQPFPESESLIHEFSKELEKKDNLGSTPSEDELRSVLVDEQRIRKQEREQEIRQWTERFNSPQPEDDVLFQRTKWQLIKVMEQFQNLVPGNSKTLTPLPRSWKEVERSLAEVSARSDAKEETTSGRVKGWIRKLCNGLNSHSTILKLLPTESEYVSVIAGAVTLFIKASANYSRITESFTKGFVEINDAVTTVQNQILLYGDNACLQHLVMRLYARIFAYLVNFMTWFQERSAKRFLHSLNESKYRKYQDDLDDIKKISSLISTHVVTLMAADGKLNQLLSQGVNENLNYLVKSAESQTRVRDRADKDLFQQVLQVQHTVQKTMTKEDMAECFRGIMDQYWNKMRQDITAASLRAILDNVAAGQLKLTPTSISVASSVCCPSTSVQSPYLDTTGNLTTEVYRESDVADQSAQFENFFSWTHVDPLSETGVLTPLLSEVNFVSRLHVFTNDSSSSQILYAHSSYYQHDSENILRRSAAGYASLARDAGIPVVSYFVELSHEEPPVHRTRETVELTALIYALIRQVVDLLPTEFKTTARMDAERFATLDGTLRTWDQAVDILADLVRCVQQNFVLFVIDGLNLLEDDLETSLNRKIERLVDCLRDLMRVENKTVKILLTTAGMSGPVSRRLREEDMVACNTASPASSSRHRNGRQVLNY